MKWGAAQRICTARSNMEQKSTATNLAAVLPDIQLALNGLSHCDQIATQPDEVLCPGPQFVKGYGNLYIQYVVVKASPA